MWCLAGSDAVGDVVDDLVELVVVEAGAGARQVMQGVGPGGRHDVPRVALGRIDEEALRGELHDLALWRFPDVGHLVERLWYQVPVPRGRYMGGLLEGMGGGVGEHHDD